ncbi:MAG: N-methyl-L-tryptophan oxidase [Hyphomicrobiales bacterium]|nr:N-methyl-L-tryptophan oxidase [Hyphomicrobiales bacterium]MBV8824491.1 N-methyl-L-tryptophan oxidase [Hyphomicrobiales bacterium]
MTYELIVIGVGGMGSATIYHAARRGLSVLGLEQFDIPHAQGSSHGVNRIIRLAYYEHPSYVPLLRRAYELWRELENRAGERLLIITGSIDIGSTDSRTIEGSLLSCKQHHLPHELLDAAALRARFPGYQIAAEMVGVYQADGGFLLSEQCMLAHVMAAQALGAEVHARERVLAWHAEEQGVTVTTTRGTYSARKLVITAGAWARTMVPALQRAAVPERQVMIWTQPRKPENFQLGAFPVFNMEAPEGRFYGFPVYGIPGFKLGKYHHRGEAVADPDHLDRECHPEDEAVLREGIRCYFPDADGPTMAMKACMFTNSPDEHFIIDRLPDNPHVAIAAGFSGHGFKFASVIGEIMSEVVVDGASRLDTSLFRLDRPALDNPAPAP